MPEVKEADDLPMLPIDRYKLGKRATKEFDTARDRLAQRCMVGLGFADFPLDPKPPKSSGSSGSSLLTLRLSETPLGPLDLDRAKRWGYGWAPKASPLGGAGPKGRAMTDKEYAALYGLSSSRAPKGGCAGQGDRQLLKGVEDTTHMWAYPSRREERLEKAVAKEPRLRKAVATWSDCVVDKGFKRYGNPEAARKDKGWGTSRDGNTTHTEREVGTAVADIECKRKHNTLGVWWSVMAKRQRADIDRNKAAYEAVRRDLDTLRANARSIP
ncbi:hypothetical protein [Streptomyces sp. Rer75]|uniref:hypothetical protein n=1 Tax=Streptomyces sp. Rer75 TaxID=2750011 RepID=UPI00211EB1A3|nr:hypothetical protein [Streptomyces sp. Rer75]